jgi:hypothetical protein
LFAAADCTVQNINSKESGPVNDDELYTMGFEAETSVIKIPSSYPNMLFESSSYQWAFTLDTPDNQKPPQQALQEDEELSNFLNTEAKTIGGLDFDTIINSSSELIQLWRVLKEKCEKQDIPIEFHVRELPDFMKRCKENEENEKIKMWVPEQRRNPANQLVYTQITYCLPLSKVTWLLEHLSKILDHNGSTTFCKFLFRDHPDYMKEDRAIIKKEPSVNNVDGEQKAKETISRFMQKTKTTRFFQEFILEKKEFLRTAFEKLSTIKESHPSAYGLGILFIQYAYALFLDDCKIEWDEPGPKPELGMMSRIPFSELYDSLSSDDKEVFKNFLGRIEKKFLDKKLRVYKTFSSMPLQETNRISIKDWGESIVDDKKRLDKRDILSPPPECVGKPLYSMGGMSNLQLPPSHVILEVRAYSRTKIKGTEINIDNFHELIENEAKWFFRKERIEYNHGE